MKQLVSHTNTCVEREKLCLRRKIRVTVKTANREAFPVRFCIKRTLDVGHFSTNREEKNNVHFSNLVPDKASK